MQIIFHANNTFSVLSTRVSLSGKVGLGGFPPTNQKIGLSPMSPTVLHPKCWFCNFHAVFGHFAQNVSPTSRTQLENPEYPAKFLKSPFCRSWMPEIPVLVKISFLNQLGAFFPQRSPPPFFLHHCPPSTQCLGGAVLAMVVSRL